MTIKEYKLNVHKIYAQDIFQTWNENLSVAATATVLIHSIHFKLQNSIGPNISLQWQTIQESLVAMTRVKVP